MDFLDAVFPKNEIIVLLIHKENSLCQLNVSRRIISKIRSERRLMETVNLNLAHRWFIGYDLDEPVPDHSSLSSLKSKDQDS